MGGCVQVRGKYYTILYMEFGYRGFWYLQGSYNQISMDIKKQL